MAHNRPVTRLPRKSHVRIDARSRARPDRGFVLPPHRRPRRRERRALMRRRTAIGAGALTVAGLPIAAAATCRFFPHNDSDHYLVRQRDRLIGRRSVRFGHGALGYEVDIEASFDFTVPGKGLVPFRHRSREIWRAAQLWRLDADTTIGTRRTWVRARRELDDLAVHSNVLEAPLRLSGYVVPSSMWHRDTRFVRGLLDVTDGRFKLVSVRGTGSESLRIDGAFVRAERYEMRGEIERDLWYDERCILVREVRPVAHGDPIDLDRTSRTLA